MTFLYGLFPTMTSNEFDIREMDEDWSMDKPCSPSECVWIVPGTVSPADD